MTRIGSVIGAGGLIGAGVVRALQVRGVYRDIGTRVPWSSVLDAHQALGKIARGGTIEPGQDVYWCAGAGVNGMTATEARRESEMFRAFLDRLPSGVRVFLSSSAGGVYATGMPPFTEYSVAEPASDYGRCKIRMERDLVAWARGGRGQAVIGRIANVYGPGQKLSKPQGIVSHLCQAAITGQPLNLYVPMSTKRDFLYVDDAADRIVETVERATDTVTTKILGSGVSLTIGSVIEIVQDVTKCEALTVSGRPPTSAKQATDTTLRSVILREVDQRPLMPFNTGVELTWSDLSNLYG